MRRKGRPPTPQDKKGGIIELYVEYNVIKERIDKMFHSVGANLLFPGSLEEDSLVMNAIEGGGSFDSYDHMDMGSGTFGTLDAERARRMNPKLARMETMELTT